MLVGGAEARLESGQNGKLLDWTEGNRNEVLESEEEYIKGG